MVGAPASRATATIQRRPVHSSSFRDSSPASPEGASSVSAISIRPGSKRTDADGVLQRVLQLELALLAGERDQVLERSSSDDRARACGAVAGGIDGPLGRRARMRAAAAGNASRRGRDDRAARRRCRWTTARRRGRRAVSFSTRQRLVRRRQVGGVGEADEHHVGGGERARRGLGSPRCPSAASARRGRGRGARACRRSPRRGVRSSSVSASSSAADGASFRRVTIWVKAARSSSTTAGSAPTS